MGLKRQKHSKLVRQSNEVYRSREYLNQAEIDKMLQVAKWRGNHPIRDYALILMLFRHGLRAQEAAKLRWDAISFEDRSIFIRRLKNSNSGTHPLNPDEVEALRKLHDTYREKYPGWVFFNQRGGTLSSDAINRIVQLTAIAAKLDIKVHTHMLRHTAGYILCNKGHETRLIQDYLGHKDIRHTVLYTKLNPTRFSQISWDTPTPTSDPQPRPAKKRAIYIIRK